VTVRVFDETVFVVGIRIAVSGIRYLKRGGHVQIPIIKIIAKTSERENKNCAEIMPDDPSQRQQIFPLLRS